MKQSEEDSSYVLTALQPDKHVECPERWDNNPANHLSKRRYWIRARKLANSIHGYRTGCTVSEHGEPMQDQREPIWVIPGKARREQISSAVKRLICVTGFGAGDSRGRDGFLYNAAFHLLLGRVYDDKDVQERTVRRSKLDWVIVRPVILTNGPKTNAYRALVDPRDWTCGFISRADVADFLVKQIDDDAFLRRTPVLTS